MWHKGDYRVIIRHEQYLTEEQIEGIIETMIRRSTLIEPMCRKSLIRDTNIVSVMILQKRIVQDNLSAWATIAVGHSLCQLEDTFSKKKGREVAFLRAMKQIQNDEWKAAFQQIWNENQPTPKPKKQRVVRDG